MDYAKRTLYKNLVWMRETHPFVYKVIDSMVDILVFILTCTVIVGIAMYMVENGYSTYEAALVGAALVNINLLALRWVIRQG